MSCFHVFSSLYLLHLGQNPLPRTSKESNSSIPTKENGLFGYLFVPGKEESKKNIENDKGMQSRLPGMPENTKLPKREEQNEKKGDY